MGQENSTPIDPSIPSRILAARNLKSVAAFLKSPECKQVAVMTGAGISTSAGLPDFRSPGTGLYANLQKYQLPRPEAVFDISYFRENPQPFYTLANELYPGNFCPTITHSFVVLLHQKQKLQKHFTQNIDCLDREAGLPGDKIVEAHGSFANQSCIECKAPFPKDLIMQHVKDATIPTCMACNGYVKPEITFFGEALPDVFHQNAGLPRTADLILVMGTSLQVGPFNQLPNFAAEEIPRVLINMEEAGSIGSRPDDVVLIGDCDTKVKELAAACGWLEELEALHQQVASRFPQKQPEAKSGPRDVDAEVEKLADAVSQQVKVSDNHVSAQAPLLDKVRKDVEEDGPGPKAAPPDDAKGNDTKARNDVPSSAGASEAVTSSQNGRGLGGEKNNSEVGTSDSQSSGDRIGHSGEKGGRGNL